MGRGSIAVVHMADMFWCMVQYAENAIKQKFGGGGAGAQGAGAGAQGAGAPTGAGQAGQGRSPVLSPLLLSLPILVNWSFPEVRMCQTGWCTSPPAPVVLS